MAYFEIGVWTSQELHDLGAGDPNYWLKQYIKENIKYDTGHDVDVYLGSTHPNPPFNSGADPNEFPGWYPHPCTGDDYYYNHGGEWWVDYHTCKNLYSANDANLLVIHYDSSWGVAMGGCGDSKHCLAEGERVGDFSTIEDQGCGMKYAQMFSTVLHEIGHAITPAEINGVEDEKAGIAEYKNGENYFSPMVTKEDPNACGHANDYNSGDSYDDCWLRAYSQCMQDHLEPVSNRSC